VVITEGPIWQEFVECPRLDDSSRENMRAWGELHLHRKSSVFGARTYFSTLFQYDDPEFLS
jgi:hypothetical protein